LSGEILEVIREEIKDTNDNLEYLDPETRKAEFDKYETSINKIDYEEVPIYDEGDYVGLRFVERGIGIIEDNPGMIVIPNGGNTTINTTDNINTNIANVVPEWLRTIT
jgi:hypothetical protein